MSPLKTSFNDDHAWLYCRCTLLFCTMPLQNSLQSITLIFTLIIIITSNTFCGTWYMPHSQVHNDRTVPIIMARCIADAQNGRIWTSVSKILRHHRVPRPLFSLRSGNFGSLAINKGYTAYFSLRMLSYFHFQSKIWRHLDFLKLRKADIDSGRYRITSYLHVFSGLKWRIGAK